VKKAQRKVVIFASLVGVLMFTSALLMALAPAPLTPDATNSLFAIDAPSNLDAIFQTNVPASATAWKYIYIHHSRSTTSNSPTIANTNGELADHFVIGNGDGLVDGEVQMGQRWEAQQSAAAPGRGMKIDPSCISICVVGDFDQSRPTPTQIRRLAQLVSTLQAHYHIPLAHVALAEQTQSVAGIGRFFPGSAFREQLIP
jgi:N-acetyl-anhydromuramyl-L-alanine amidase AmpD